MPYRAGKSPFGYTKRQSSDMARREKEYASTLVDLLLLVAKVLWYYLEALVLLVVPRKHKSLRGEVAVVTGAGHGIGRQLVLQLAAKGVAVVGWDINLDACRDTAAAVNKAGGRAWAVHCDVSNREEVAKAAQKTRELAGKVTLLVNNAGIMPAKPFLDQNPKDVERIFQVNVFSQFWTLFEFLPDMMTDNRGHIVSMASVAGWTGTPYLSTYCASKHAVRGLVDAIQLELRQDCPGCNVRITTVNPFTINTGLAHEPTTRFPSLIPILEAEECARIIIDGIATDEEEVFVPKMLKYPFRVGRALPRKVQLALNDFLDCGVGYKKND